MSDSPPRNAPCPCGSGKKYKRCCQLLEKKSTHNLDEENLLDLARKHKKSRRWEQAQLIYLQLLKSSPQKIEYLLALGQICKESGKFSDAIKYLYNALKINPNNDLVENLLIETIAEESKLSAFTKVGKQEEKINFAKLLNSKAHNFQSKGDYESAINSFKKALVVDPMYTVAMNNLASLLRRLKRLNEAKDILEYVIKISPMFVEAYINLGNVFYELAEFQKAIQQFTRAKKINSNNANAHNNMGLSYWELGMNSEALVCFERASAIAVDNTNYIGCIANTYLYLGQVDKAIETIKNAIVLFRKGGKARCLPVRPQNAKVAYNVLLTAKSLLEKANIPFFLRAGTLLGVIREGEILSFDKDIDLGIPWHTDQLSVLTALTKGSEFRSKHGVTKESKKRWNISFIHIDTGVALDICFFKPDGDFFLVGNDGDDKLRRPILNRLRKFEIGNITWNDEVWPIPERPEQYLVDVYGDDWKIPNPNFDSLTSSHCMMAEAIDLRRYYGYYRLFQRIIEHKWSKALGYCEQIEKLKSDLFLTNLTVWLKANKN